jgi:hypothetical protein
MFGWAVGEVTYFPEVRPRYMEADSVYLGADLEILDGEQQIQVIRKDARTVAVGELHFIPPEKTDSSVFLFHNIAWRYETESDTVALGRYPKGTEITFMYMVTDTQETYSYAKDKKVYTGQNDSSLGQPVSEISGPLGRRWCVVGYLGEGICEVACSATKPWVFKEIRFLVTNVKIPE